MKQETRTYTITSSPKILDRIERLFAMLHWNSKHGHTGIFGMLLDGDGPDEVTVEPEPNHRKGVSAISDVGYDVELASDDGFWGLFKDYRRKVKWTVGPDDEIEVDSPRERMI